MLASGHVVAQMAFIRHKDNRSGTVSHHVVETFREGARVRHRTLVSLEDSPSIDDRLAVLREWCDFYEEARRAASYRGRDRKFHTRSLEAMRHLRYLKRLQQDPECPGRCRCDCPDVRGTASELRLLAGTQLGARIDAMQE